MEELEGKLVELLDRAEELGIEIAPDVWDAPLRATYFDGAVAIATGSLILIVSLAVSTVLVVLERKDPLQDYIVPAVGVGILGTLLGIIPLVAGNPWMKVFDPQAALIQKLLLQ